MPILDIIRTVGDRVASTASGWVRTHAIGIGGNTVHSDGTAEFFCITTGIFGGDSTVTNDYELVLRDGDTDIEHTRCLLEPPVASTTFLGAHYAFGTKITKLRTSPRTSPLPDIALWMRVSTADRVASCVVDSWLIPLDDLVEGQDWLSAETSPVGNAPQTYTDGASIQLPGGISPEDDWVIFATTHWLVDSTNADMSMRIVDGDESPEGHHTEARFEGEDTSNQHSFMTTKLTKGSPAGSPEKVVKVQYKNSANNNDCDHTEIFALRLNIFKNYMIDQTAVGAPLNTFGGPFSPTPPDADPLVTEFDIVGITASPDTQFMTMAFGRFTGTDDNNQREILSRVFDQIGSPSRAAQSPYSLELSPQHFQSAGDFTIGQMGNNASTELHPVFKISRKDSLDSGQFDQTLTTMSVPSVANVGDPVAEDVDFWHCTFGRELAEGVPSPQSPQGGGGSPTPVSLTSDDFRFRENDGSESAATWIAAQDTDITRPQGQT